MVGHPKHVEKALSVGMDIICAQVSYPTYSDDRADPLNREEKVVGILVELQLRSSFLHVSTHVRARNHL